MLQTVLMYLNRTLLIRSSNTNQFDFLFAIIFVYVSSNFDNHHS